MGARTLACASLAALLTCGAVASAGQRGEGQLVSVDLKDTPLEEALKAVFAAQPGRYTFTLPAGMDLPLTISLHNVSLDQAVTALLDFYSHAYDRDLTYHRDGTVYVVADSGHKREAEPPLTLEFSATPLADALEAILHGTPYTFKLDDPGLADLVVTMRIQDTPWSVAFTDVLGQYALWYDQKGKVLHVSSGSPEQLAGVEGKLAPGKHAMLYVTEFGARDQLRLRVFPYLGAEQVKWPGAEGLWLRYYLPSPSFRYVALFVGSFPTRAFVQELATRRTREVAKGVDVEYGLWKGEDTLHLLSEDRDAKQWTERIYDAQTRQMTAVQAHPSGEPADADTQIVDLLKSPFATQIEIISSLIRGRKDTDGREIVLPLAQDEVVGAVLRGAGIAYVPWVTADLPVTYPVATVSPDGEYLAVTSGRYAVFVIFISEYGSHVARVIPLTEVVTGESVRVEDLRWATDSTRRTFTEVHYHPSGSSMKPGASHFVPDPLDSTYLVRMCTREGDQLETLAVGRNAFLLPQSVPVPRVP